MVEYKIIIQIFYYLENLPKNLWYDKEKFYNAYNKNLHEDELIINGEYCLSRSNTTLIERFSASVVYITVRNTNKNNPSNGYITQIATAIYDIQSPIAIRFRRGDTAKKWTPWKYLKFSSEF